MARSQKPQGYATKWNPYAEQWDLVVDTEEELETIEQAARTLSTAMDSIPGWVLDIIDLPAKVDLLDNVTLKGSDDDN